MQLHAASVAEREEAAAVSEMLLQISLGPPVNLEALKYIRATAAFFEVRPALSLGRFWISFKLQIDFIHSTAGSIQNRKGK